MSHRSIAIDGPSGAGKSTLAKMLASELGFLYVDTGAIYRTVGLAVFRRGLDPHSREAVAAVLPELEIGMAYAGDGLQHMYLNGEDVTAAIRKHEISAYASAVSAIPEVRAFLLEMQRRLARDHDVIMDGRDIGTVVLPGADLKIYLTADAADRARRRFLELKERGQEADFDAVLRDVSARDRQDMEREIAPLRRAQDAVLADTTGIGLEESYRLLLRLIGENLPMGGVCHE